MTRYEIKGKQSDFSFACGLPSPNDYGILILPSWDTTIFIVEKTNREFKVKFGKPCPSEGGWIDLTLYTPKTQKVSLGSYSGYVKRRRELKMKIPKEVDTV
jgi:hypothetical protein